MRKSQDLKSFLSMLLDKCHCLKGSGWPREEEFQRKENVDSNNFGEKGLYKRKD